MKKLKVLFWIVLLCFSCSNVKETPKGFQYTVVRKGDGVATKPGQFLVMHMVFKDGKDSVWNDTRTADPMLVMVMDTTAMRQEDGIEEIFRMLTRGDSITFKIPAKQLFEKTFHQPLPKRIDPSSEFTFNMSVNEVYDREEAMKFNQKLQAHQSEEMVKLRRAQLGKYLETQRAQLEKDGALIDSYLKKNRINAVQDTTGLRYVVTSPGTGDKPSLSQVITVNYIGKLMENGKVFDQSKTPATFRLITLIPGWQIGFPLLPVGSKATLYVPSSLGYGPKGSPPNIPPDANLIFEIELVKAQDIQ